MSKFNNDDIVRYNNNLIYNKLFKYDKTYKVEAVSDEMFILCNFM